MKMVIQNRTYVGMLSTPRSVAYVHVVFVSCIRTEPLMRKLARRDWT